MGKVKVSDIKNWLITVWPDVFLVNKHMGLFSISCIQTPIDELFIRAQLHATNDSDSPAV